MFKKNKLIAYYLLCINNGHISSIKSLSKFFKWTIKKSCFHQDMSIDKARDRFSGNDTNALVAMMNSSDIPLKDRNLAVWALGQLGDTRAAASLEKLLAGKPCEHASAVCQRELKKAIRHCRGGANVTRWAWKPFVL